MTSDSQLMDSRDVDSTEENENAKEDVAEITRKSRLLSLFLYYPISFLSLMVGAILIRCVMVLIIAYLYLPVSLPRFLY